MPSDHQYQQVAGDESHRPENNDHLDSAAAELSESVPLVEASSSAAVPYLVSAADDEAELDEEDQMVIDALKAPQNRRAFGADVIIEEATLGSSSSPGETPRATPVSLGLGNDGVFTNIPAKPDNDVKEAEEPPPYAEAAQDSVPPYYDTTILSDDPDEIMVEGLAVGSSFSFIWNMMIAMTFQFVGFMLTYLLHTSHASKNGSLAGLGITMIQYGLYLRSKDFREDEYAFYASQGDGSTAADQAAKAAADSDSEWAHSSIISFILMIVGWFLVIRATSEYIRIRRILAVIMATPDGSV